MSVNEIDDGIDRVLLGPFLTKKEGLLVKKYFEIKSFGEAIFVTL